MRLAVSNLAWRENEDQSKIDLLLKKYQINDLELAISKQNYDKLIDGRNIRSLQSILYGSTENIFNSEEDRVKLLKKIESIVIAAKELDCRHLVFGCPMNRRMLKQSRDEYFQAIRFFRRLVDRYRHITIGIEPISERYACNFINDFRSAVIFKRHVDRKNFKINLDLANIYESDVTFEEIKKNLKDVSHIHISEKDLSEIKVTKLLKDLIEYVEQDKELNDRLIFSIESKDLTLEQLQNSIRSIKTLFKSLQSFEDMR